MREFGGGPLDSLQRPEQGLQGHLPRFCQQPLYLLTVTPHPWAEKHRQRGVKVSWMGRADNGEGVGKEGGRGGADPGKVCFARSCLHCLWTCSWDFPLAPPRANSESS